jgi:hypothetical protein
MVIMILALVWSVCCLEVRVWMDGQDGDEAYSSVYVRVGECVRVCVCMCV